MSNKSNILFILVDQMRADCLSGALGEHINLPNLRALQKEAVTFEQHYSVTNPCGPSRASIFTGKYAMNHRSIRNGTPLTDGVPNLAIEVRKAGYEPLLFGYSDTSLDPRSRHVNDPALHNEEELLPGFTQILEMRAQQSFPWRASLKAKGYDLPDYSRFYDPVSPDPSRAARPNDPPFYLAKDSDTAFLTDTLLDYLSVRSDESWFAVATYIRPHPPLVAPEPFNKMYDPAKVPLPNRLASPDHETAIHPALAVATLAPSMQNLVKGCEGQLDQNNNADIQMLRALYLGLITELDNHIGRIIRFLKDTGQYDNTLIIFKADHGEMLGDHYLWGKQHVYDPCFRVPLIIRDPRHPDQHGSTVSSFTESIDITPTILDYAGLDVPSSMDGKSLRPFLDGSDVMGWKDCVQLELDFSEPNVVTGAQKATGLPLDQCNLAILREARFKLVHFNGELEPLLFDLENDPNEMQNLASDPAHMGTLLRMTRKLLSHRMTHMDKTLSGIKITSAGVFGYTPQ